MTISYKTEISTTSQSILALQKIIIFQTKTRNHKGIALLESELNVTKSDKILVLTVLPPTIIQDS